MKQSKYMRLEAMPGVRATRWSARWNGAFPWALALAVVGAFLQQALCRADATPALPGSRPNVVLFLADDLSYYDLSYLGQRHFHTPNLDRLARQGMTFTNAYAGAPECAPSRASLMTGMHMGHCRIRANRSARGQDHLVSEDQTIAEVLKQAGYATAFIGKWGIGLPGTPGTPDKQGFDYSYGYYDQLRAHGFFPEYLMENGQEVLIPENHGFNMNRAYEYNRRTVDNLEGVANQYDEQGRLVPDGVADPSQAKYSEYLFRKAACRFIRQNSDRPLFLYYATQLPHGPLITPDLGPYKNKPWDLKHKEWAAMVHTMDQSAGMIVDELKRQGVFDNTVFFFASDNGYSQWGYFHRPPWQDDPLFENKGPWHKGKFICTDGGGRVPLFVSWPGRIAPGTCDHVTALFDLLPTTAELAGVQPERPTDGLSLVPLLEGRPTEQPEHPYLYWENGSMSPHAQAARRGHWYAFREHPSKPLQLYDLTADVGCTKDLAGAHPAVVRDMLDIFGKAHVDSTWYTNPGDSRQVVSARRQRAQREGTLQIPTRANSKYSSGPDRRR